MTNGATTRTQTGVRMIKHIKCDIFKSGADIICHQVNCQGVMGSGIAKQVREKYPVVYEKYKHHCDIYSPKALLGIAQFVGTQERHDTPFLGIFNLYAQEKYGYDGKQYTNYDAIYKCLEKLKESIPENPKGEKYVVAIPYMMSCCRGGGNWETVYGFIEDILGNDERFDILICEYNGG